MTMEPRGSDSKLGASASGFVASHKDDTQTVGKAEPTVAGGEAIRVSGVFKSYNTEGVPVRALRGVDLTVDRGEFVALTGSSGSGKSTLLNLIAGLDRPDEGEISIVGQSLPHKSDDDLARLRREHIGFVFQFFNLLDGVSVLENVALPGLVSGLRRKQAETRARDLLDLLGIGDKAHQSPLDLSGGQRQRLSIARALANDPAVLLADEPTGALDSESSSEILELMRRLHTGALTILLVTHDPEVAAAAQRSVRLADGRVTPSTGAAG